MEVATKDDLIIQRIEDLKDSTEQRLDSIDTNLAEHMEQTMLVREQNAEIRIQNIEIVKQTKLLGDLHKDNQTRIGALEEPKKALLYIRGIVVYFAAISASAISVVKLLEYLP